VRRAWSDDAGIHGQTQQIWAYSNLYQQGDQVVGYAETDLLSPSLPCWETYVWCWWQYNSYVEATLYNNWQYRASYWYEQFQGGCCVMVWAPLAEGSWSLRSNHGVSDIYYNTDCGIEMYYPYLFQFRERYIAIYPAVTISGDQYVPDSEYSWAAFFYLLYTGAQPTSFDWSFEAEPGAGNWPNVSFSNPSGSFTWTNSHWHANPDSPCDASLTSTYTITGTARFGQIERSAQASLGVTVPWNPGGGTFPPELTVVSVSYKFQQSMYMIRDAVVQCGAPQVVIYVNPSSQFHYKVWIHGQEHVQQFGPGRILGDLYNADELRNLLIGISAPTLDQLSALATDVQYLYLGLQNAVLELRAPYAEREGCQVSDQSDPRYVYQGCGR